MHNDTFANNIFPIDKVEVGKYTYGVLNVNSYRNKEEYLKIGNFCSIASEVLFVLSGEHRMDCLSSFPFSEKIYHDTNSSALTKGSIIVEDDVWIGVRCTILSGVTIGQGSVIGANSIVYKDIPPYSVYVGNKIVRKRFSDAIINKLLTLDFSLFNDDILADYKGVFCTPITDNNIDKIIAKLPKKESE